MYKRELSIINDVAELHKVNAVIDEITADWALSKKVSMNINLVLEEVISNIIFYGFDDKKEHLINIDFIKENMILKIVITDVGYAFDPLSTKEFDGADKPVEEREVGGLGIHFVRTLMDQIEYTRLDNKNILTLIKKIAD